MHDNTWHQIQSREGGKTHTGGAALEDKSLPVTQSGVIFMCIIGNAAVCRVDKYMVRCD